MKKSILFALLTLFASSVFAGELEDILKKHFEAIGGTEALDNLNSMTMKANVSMNSPQGQMEIPMEIAVKDKTKVRMDMSIQGMSMTQAFDGEKGWTINPFMGETAAQDMNDEDSKSMKKMSQTFTGLYKYEERGDKLELIGKADVEGAEAYELKVTDADGEESFIYIDTEYYLVVKTKGVSTQMGMEMEMHMFVSDYKKVDNLMLPHSMAMKNGDDVGIMTMTISEFGINPEIADDKFVKPAAAAPATPDNQ